MNKKTKNIIIIITSIECLIVFILLYIFYRNIIVGEPFSKIVNINPIRKENIVFSPSEEYRYYYELPKEATDEARINWLPNGVKYTYNHDGLNERFNYDLQKLPDSIRIVTMGDSFVFGMWVDTKDNFSELLEDKLNTISVCKNQKNIEVINIGVPGYDLRYEFHRYEDKGTKYSPDLVIWFMRDENIYLNADKYLGLQKYYQKQLDATVSGLNQVKDQNPDLSASDLSFRKNLDTFYRMSFDEQTEYFKPEVESLYNFRKLYNPNLLIVTTEKSKTRYKTILKEFAKSNPKNYYLEIPDFQTFHPYDYHPNVVGHQQISDAILEYLRRNKLICQ
jgi:hypothetical protein